MNTMYLAWAVLTATLVACAVEEATPLRTSLRRAEQDSTDDGSKKKRDDGDDDGDDDAPKAPPSASDAAAPAPPPPLITAFGNAGAFATITPPTQSARHDGWRTNAGQDCMACHDGKTPGVPRFVIAGTVYATKGSTTGARNVQVRVVDATGTEVAMVGSDDAGNFWLKAGAITELPAGASVGVRNALSTKLMGGKIGAANSGSCNRFGCHAAGKGIHVQ